MKPFRIVAVGILAVAGLLGTAVPAAAGPQVDPSTLQPPPPPGADCQLDGRWIICQTSVQTDPVNELFYDGLPCGNLYETGSHVSNGTRWYNADDRKLVKRFFTHTVDATVSLSPTGDGPTADLATHYSVWEFLTIPGDLSSASGPQHGVDLLISTPGYGTITLLAGFAFQDEFRGSFTFPDQPDVAAELCEALSA
ncbi:MAG: hypothetical protein ACRDWG_20495 [Actinomycetes bacterium]